MFEMLEKLKLKIDKQLEKNRSLSPFRPSGQLNRVLSFIFIFDVQEMWSTGGK